MTVVLVVGATDTAAIPGISAAGVTPAMARHTPAADAELIAFGRTVRAPAVPCSPTGCPTPAVVTRAVRELIGFPAVVVDAGLAAPTGAPTAGVGAHPGADLRETEAVPDAPRLVRAGRALGRSLAGERVWIGESIPGGTTTALGVLAALGEAHGVSSSLPENPLELKRQVVAEGLAASGLQPGAAAGDPVRALRLMGDPVLATLMGLAAGAIERGISVWLAGGTQLVATAALLRHDGFTAPLGLATTAYVEADPAVDLPGAAAALDLELTVSDPGFDRAANPALTAFARGEAKEGAGMGGVLALAGERGVDMDAVRRRVTAVYDRLGVGRGP